MERSRRDNSQSSDGIIEIVLKINRTSKVVKAGKNFSFSTITIAGDRKGMVGYGFGKAKDVSEAIKKSSERAKKAMVKVPQTKGTIPHEIWGRYKSTYVLLKPACPGSGIIAGGAVRAIMEAGGITDILTKCIGSRNQSNMVKAVFNGMSRMLDAKTIAHNRGKGIRELWG